MIFSQDDWPYVVKTPKVLYFLQTSLNLQEMHSVWLINT